MTVPHGHEQQVAEFASSLSQDARQTYCLGGTVKYELPCKDVALSQVFDRVEEAKRGGLQVLDWGVHNASLEDVFIKLATADQQSESASGLIENGHA